MSANTRSTTAQAQCVPCVRGGRIEPAQRVCERRQVDLGGTAGGDPRGFRIFGLRVFALAGSKRVHSSRSTRSRVIEVTGHHAEGKHRSSSSRCGQTARLAHAGA